MNIPEPSPVEKSPGQATASDTLTFLRWLYGDDAPGWLTICTFDRQQPTQWFSANHLEQIATYCQAIARRYHVYFGLGMRQEQLDDGRGESGDVLGVPGLWIEIDLKHVAHKKVNLPETTEQAMALLGEAIPLKPSLIIHSGYGIHVYWVFRELWIFNDTDDRQAAYHLLRRLQATIQGVAKLHSWDIDSTFDLARVLRLPGTYNRKVPDDPKLITILEAHPDRRYNPSDFAEHLIHIDEMSYQQTTPPEDTGDRSPVDIQTLSVPAWLKYLIHLGHDPDYLPSDSTRSAAQFKALQGLIEHGIDDATILSLMMDPRYGISEKPREKGPAWLAKDLARAHAKLNGHQRVSDEEDPRYHTGANGTHQEKPTSRPKIIHAEVITEEPIEWLWEPYLPRSMLVMLDGDPGLGKSMMLLQVAANLSRGRPFLDQLGKPTVPADVDGPQATLILSAEDSLEHIMVPRLRRAGADLAYIRFLDGWLTPDNKERTFTLKDLWVLIAAIQEVKPALVILDPLVAYLGEIDMHRSNQTRPLMANLKTLAQRYHCTIMGVRHPSKLDQGGPLMYKGQGNLDIVGAARSALWVQKHPTHQADQTLMIHSKTNIGAPGRSVIFSRARGEFQWVGVTRLAEWMLSSRGPDPYAFLEAFFWLEETMTPGVPYPSAEIEEKAKAKDISPRTLARARKYIGAEPTKVGNRWVCTLPSLE